tara:strand:- start:137 stop:601 length:465 start_codon:yes stop_codon:yes gene_type:complete
MSLVDAQANVFMWWGLIYSLAPDKETNPKVREKHRDEGLVLVEEQPGTNGRQKFIEKTKKFYVLKQFVNFLSKGCKRISVNSPKPLMVSAYSNEDENKVVIIAINPSNQTIGLDVEYAEGINPKTAFQTDRHLNCEKIKPSVPLAPNSIRTIVY